MPSPAQLDHRFIWHPFTQMRDWLRAEPIVITSGEGALLRDTRSRTYIDANSSIWTNLHGHRHPKINAAITAQLKKIAHSSALGLANEPASILASRLIQAANTPEPSKPSHPLAKVFFSDDGSTAMEVALKLAYEYSRRTRPSRNPRFLSLDGAYHGDTIGAVSLGHIDLFHKAYSGLLFKTDKTPAPYCYRCKFNKAKPERADARTYRKCNMECLDVLRQKFLTAQKKRIPYSAFVFEPLIQGAAGMIAQPDGWLKKATTIAQQHGALLIADEVLTGFGRTGSPPTPLPPASSQPHEQSNCSRRRESGPESLISGESGNPPLFACQREHVSPDFIALAKGLTGGYLPMAATLTNQRVFDAFLGDYHEFKTFFHGHSYTGNQLGAAASLASLDILHSPASIKNRNRIESDLDQELQTLWQFPNVGDIRRVGLIAGIELVKDWKTRKPFQLREQAGIRVCKRMAELGVLTRPIGNVVPILPPYCTTTNQVHTVIHALGKAIDDVLG